jgi:FtsP/CotA-like multicopper oxidase with cupredoxin domain
MKHTRMTRLLRRSALVLALLSLLAGTAAAQTVDLVADVYTWNGITMWGFAADASQACGAGGTWTPGPTIEVDLATTTGLTINLRNCLAEPASIVIPGQALKGAPVFNGAGRVTSFADEAAPNGGTATYSWTAAELKPGTFAYSSGSHPAKQVHMGLYGAAVVNVDSTAGEAYPGIFFDQDIVVLYSAVDPDLHATESAAKAVTYKPKFFLVNGDETGTSVLTSPAAPLNSKVLLRFVNAGLKSYVPTLLGEDMDWIAEDGNPYPFVRRSYSAFLAAGQTMDAIWVPTSEDRHALYDRRLHLTGNGIAGGGLRAFLDSAFVALPTANAGPDQLQVPMFTAGLPTVVQFDGGPATGVTYQWTLTGFPAGSTASLSDPTIANPTLTLDVPGTYTAQLVVDDGANSSNPDMVNIFTNLPPIAVAAGDTAVDSGAVVQLYATNHCSGTGPVVTCSSDSDCAVGETCIMGSYDPDGDALSFSWTVNSIFLSNDPNPTFTAGAAGSYIAEVTVSDFELDDTASLNITATDHVNQPPDAVIDYYSVEWKTADNPLNVLDNDSDPDGALVPSTLTIITEPITPGSTAMVAETSAGSGVYVVYYTPKPGFKGTDFFTYQICDDGIPQECSEGSVWVNVVKNLGVVN